ARVPRGLLHQRRQLSLSYQQLRLGIAQDVRRLPFAIQNIDRNEDHAQLDRGQIQIDELDAVGQIDAQPIAPAQPPSLQRMRHPIAARIDLAEGVFRALPLQRNIVPPVHQRQIEKLTQIHSGSVFPLVSTPHGSRKIPARNAIDVSATGTPMVPILPIDQPISSVTPAARNRPNEVANPNALARHSVRYCSGSHSAYMVKFAPPNPSTISVT